MFNGTLLNHAATKDHKEVMELLLRQKGIAINLKELLNH